MILCSNPLSQYQSQKDAIDAAVHRVLDRGWYVLGEETSAFESEFAAFLEVAHAVGVGSGTEALHIALKACGIGSGHEVITVSHTAVATVAAIELAGATPVLIDIEPEFYTLDPASLERAITSRTRAVISVHLYGQPANLDAIVEICSRRNLYLIEDCAQCHGSRYAGKRVGSFGDIGCFSFYPTKNLGAIGDGGAAVTDNPDLAAKLQLLRQYGWSERHVSLTPGWNSRLDEIQAAILRVKLQRLDEANAVRGRLAARYDEALHDLDLVLPARRNQANHVFHLYVVRVQQRDHLMSHLRENQIGSLIHYPVPIHQQPAYQDRITTSGVLTQTELAADQVLSLPMYPGLTDDEQDRVIAATRAFFGS